ncbi:MAG TPA: CoA ester lyase [Candidatus Thermoplasmatota archaeon]|nr:CoA ester lyase [Candidatus Thermoplasmatota archaeon]
MTDRREADAWRPRRTLLFTPGTRADRWEKALSGPADVAVADLEDGVAPADKQAAREAVARALAHSKSGRTERGVRINAWGALARADLAALAQAMPELVVLPKVERAEEVEAVDRALTQAGCPARLLLLFETARGVLDAPALAQASRRVAAVAFGAEDYAANVGARRTREGTEVLFARSLVVAAAAAAGVEAVDQVFVDFQDDAGLERDAREGARLGYRGKQVIHPRQVEIVHRALAPSPDEVAWARKVSEAARAGGVEEGGVVVVDGRMIDRPLVAQAERTLRLAELP